MNFARLLRLITVSTLVISSTRARADEPKTITVTVPGADKIAIRIPPTWTQTLFQPTPELPPSVRITSAANTLSLQLTFIPDPEGRFAAKEGVDRAVTQANQQYVPGSVEKRLTLTQLVSNLGHGCYSAFTDAELARVPIPPPGQFRNVSSGVFVIKKQAASFTLLSNDTSSPAYRQALQIISEGISTL
jgi:hypothetical protein